jgi:hypothetical protein
MTMPTPLQPVVRRPALQHGPERRVHGRGVERVGGRERDLGGRTLEPVHWRPGATIVFSCRRAAPDERDGQNGQGRTRRKAACSAHTSAPRNSLRLVKHCDSLKSFLCPPILGRSGGRAVLRCAGVHELNAIRPHIVNTSERWLLRRQHGVPRSRGFGGAEASGAQFVDLGRAGMAHRDQG